MFGDYIVQNGDIVFHRSRVRAPTLLATILSGCSLHNAALSRLVKNAMNCGSRREELACWHLHDTHVVGLPSAIAGLHRPAYALFCFLHDLDTLLCSFRVLHQDI